MSFSDFQRKYNIKLKPCDTIAQKSQVIFSFIAKANAKTTAPELPTETPDKWVKAYQDANTNALLLFKPHFDEEKKTKAGDYKGTDEHKPDLMLAVEKLIEKNGNISCFDATARIFLCYVFELFYSSYSEQILTFTIAEYAERCGITVKQAYERMRVLHNTFENLKINIPGAKGFIRILNIIYNKSVVQVSIQPEFYACITENTQYSMYTPRYMQLINTRKNPHTYYITMKLAQNAHMQNIGRQTTTKHRLKNLVESAAELPERENVKGGRYKESIIHPFLRDLNKLNADGFADIKLYAAGKEIDFETAKNLKIDDFMKLEYTAVLSDYPTEL